MLQHRCNTNLTNVTSHTRRHPITLVDDEYLVCFCVCPPNEIPCWRLFQNLKVTDKTHKSGKQLAKILFEHYDTFLQQNARETNLRDMWRDANPHCCKIISLAHNGMNWCYTPFSYNGCGWRYTYTSMPPEKQILRFRPGVRRSLNPSLIHSIHPTWVRFSNLCLKNYPLNNKNWLSLTFNGTQQYPTLWHGSFYLFRRVKNIQDQWRLSQPSWGF